MAEYGLHGLFSRISTYLLTYPYINLQFIHVETQYKATQDAFSLKYITNIVQYCRHGLFKQLNKKYMLSKYHTDVSQQYRDEL